MSSINTNSSAMLALQSLSATNKALGTTQSRISTGLRVAEASDNAAYWSIATTMRSDNKAFSAVQDALGLGAGKIDTAYTAMNKAIEVVDQIKAKAITAVSSSDEDRGKIQTEIEALKGQLNSIAVGANYAGSNLLATDTAADLTIVASYNRDTTGAVSMGYITVAASTGMHLTNAAGDDATGAILEKVMDLDVSTAPSDTELNDIEDTLKNMATAAANLGAAKTRIDMQKDFVSKLTDSVERGIGQLVDADMNKESARLSALQVQQQLGIQALSIANSNSQNILSLFR